MKHRFLAAAAAIAALACADAAQAQWLDSHLESQRWNNLRNHQTRMRTKGVQQRDRTRAQTTQPARAARTASQPLTLSERQSAWSRNRAEYRRRVLNDGQASADRWLDGIALAAR